MTQDREYKAKTRLFLAGDFVPNAALGLSDGQCHYLTHVLRLSAGSVIEVFNGCDGAYAARFDGKDSVVLQQQIRQQTKSGDVWLLFAPLKKDATDFVIEKSSELGVSRIQPVFCEHSNTHRFNRERATEQAIQAAEQCGRLDVPAIGDAKNLTDAIRDWPQGRTLIFCDEMRQAPPLAKILPDLRNKKLAFLIGPEGGFSAKERALLQSQPFVQSAHLGENILRADTASLAALSIYQASAYI